MQSKKGLILFTRLPDYFYQCLRHYATNYNCEFDVVRYNQDSATSFNFSPHEKIRFFNRDEILSEHFILIDYDFVYTSSWRDKEYKSICKFFNKKIPVIIGLDNPWLGKFKQWVNVFLSPILLKPYFNKVWVAGTPQLKYAKKLGFKDCNIAGSLYSCDNDKFKNLGNIKRDKVLLYVGRFVDYKNPVLLASVFKELVIENSELKEWTLKLVGRGPLQDELVKYSNENIILQDFTSPEKLPDLFHSASLFCLPSNNEHWGLVVHEACSCGMPLILSDTVHSGSVFLSEGENGFSFKAGSREDFKKKLLLALKSTSSELQLMSEISVKLSKEISKDTWAEALNKLTNKNHGERG